MRLPPSSAHFSQRVRCGNYVARRLRRARLASLAAGVEKVTDEVLVSGRAVEDADKGIQICLADRDACDDDLDDAAQDARLKLASRSLDAVTRAPYTLIFPQGIGHYIAATLDEEVARYTELKTRLEENLPAHDEVRKATVAVIDERLADFRVATDAVATARTAAAIASTKLQAANEAWEKQLEKAYGVAVAEADRARAERFFPRIRGKKTPDPVPAPAP